MLVAALLPSFQALKLVSGLSYFFHSTTMTPPCLRLWFEKFFPLAQQKHASLVIPKHGPDYRENYEISQQKIKTRIYFTGKPLKSSSEIYKIKNNMSTPVMSELFEKRNLNCNFCSQADFSLHSGNTVTYGLKSMEYFAGSVWNWNILQEMCGALFLLKLEMR